MPWKVCQVSDEEDLNLKELSKIAPEERLVSEGWKKRAIYDDQRLSGMVDMYREIDFKVHLEPFIADYEKNFTNYMDSMSNLYKTIYTREKSEE